MLTQAAAPSGAAPCNAAQRNARAYSKPHRHHAPLTSSSTPLTGGLALRNVRRPPSPEPAVAFQYAETEVETAFGSEDESQQHVSSSASELAERHLKLFRPVGSGIPRGDLPLPTLPPFPLTEPQCADVLTQVSSSSWRNDNAPRERLSMSALSALKSPLGPLFAVLRVPRA